MSNSLYIQLNDIVVNRETGQVLAMDNMQSSIARLENTPLTLLLYLAEHADRVVYKHKIMAIIWRDKVVTDDVLTVAISQIRKALGDNASRPTFIKTISGKGYQVIAEVTDVQLAPDAKSHNLKVKLVLGSLVLLLLVGGLGKWFFGRTSQDTQAKLPTVDENQFNKARYLLENNDKDSKQLAHKLLSEIVVKSPQIAQVYVDLARAKLAINEGDNLRKYALRTELHELLKRALQISPDNAQAFLQSADVSYYIDWDIERAGRFYEQALALAEHNPNTHFQYAQFLMKTGRFEKARQHVNEYIRLEPSSYSQPMLVWIYTMMEDFPRAMQEFAKIKEVDSQSLNYHYAALSMYEAKGDQDAAFQALLFIFRKANYLESELMTLKKLYRQNKLKGVYAWLLHDKQEAGNIGHGLPPISFARYAIAAGEHDLALTYLKDAINTRHPRVLNIPIDPMYKTVRNDKELQRFIRLIMPQFRTEDQTQ